MAKRRSASRRRKITVNSMIFYSLLYILIGGLLIAFRSQMLNIMMTVIAVLFIATGVIDVLKKNTVTGVSNILIGAVVLILGWVAVKFVLIVLGVLLAIRGLMALYCILRGAGTSVWNILYAVLTVIGGVVLAFGNGLDIVLIVAGIVLIADGVLGIYSELK